MNNDEIYINGKFNNKHPKYKVIKITNICLLVVFMFADMIAAAAEGMRFNPIPSLITFWIARFFIRSIYTKNPDFEYKVFITIGVYIATFILKTILLLGILSLILN